MPAPRPALLPLLRGQNQLRLLVTLLLEPRSGFLQQVRSSPVVDLDLQVEP